MLPILPILLGAAASSGALTPDVKNQQAAPPAGGGNGINPMGNFFQAFEHPMNREPTGPVTPAPYTPAKPTSAPPTTEDPRGPKDGDKATEIGDLLASIPEAIALAAPLLGLGPDQTNRQPAPVAGASGQNQYAQAFGPLPKPPTLGELLAAMPRMR